LWRLCTLSSRSTARRVASSKATQCDCGDPDDDAALATPYVEFASCDRRALHVEKNPGDEES
jgi:hypothetical protein